jgi:hypothetical protein
LISQNKTIIDFLMETGDKIDAVNKYADLATEYFDKSQKKLNVRMFLNNTKNVSPDLFSIYNRLMPLKSYKEYEKTDFFSDSTKVNEEALKGYIIIKYFLRNNLIQF